MFEDLFGGFGGDMNPLMPPGSTLPETRPAMPMPAPAVPPNPMAPKIPMPGNQMPEAIAAQMVQWGVPPGAVLPSIPQGDQSLGALLAPPGPNTPGAMAPPAQTMGSDAAAPLNDSGIPPTATPAMGTAPTAPGRSPLSGLSMPTAPAAQKVSTPAAPRPTGTIKGGELLALMQALGIGGGAPPQIPGLGQAIGR